MNVCSDKIIIAIDGYSSTGKSTLAKQIAKRIHYKYIDTGAMYRAVTLFAIQHQCFENEQLNKQKLLLQLPLIHLSWEERTKEQYTLLLNGNRIEPQIRTMKVSSLVSYVARIGEVRKRMLSIQQDWGREKGIVMDGRDIGTVVFPHADLKVFMTASPGVRAKRRYKELNAQGIKVTYQQIFANVLERDTIDSTRSIAPLKPAKDAIIIDNSTLTCQDQFEKVMTLVKKKIAFAETKNSLRPLQDT